MRQLQHVQHHEHFRRICYFAGDSSPGQTTGEGNEGFGAYWWVVTPAGKAIVHGS